MVADASWMAAHEGAGKDVDKKEFERESSSLSAVIATKFKMGHGYRAPRLHTETYFEKQQARQNSNAKYTATVSW